MGRKVLIFRDPSEVARAAAEKIISLSVQAIRDYGRFTMALSGGSTPQLLYETLSRVDTRFKIDWSKWHVFVGDERFVPLNHADSNFGMATAAFLSKVPIPKIQLYPVRTGVSKIQLAVEQYTKELAMVFDGFPAFDVVLTGLGAKDCHILSLFPYSDALAERDAWVTWSPPGIMPPPINRVTLTLPVVNSAREVMLLVTGEEKAEAVLEVMENPPSEARPASLVQPTMGKATWFLDQAASSQLS